ncbi:hypothetical protein T484DRAFT_1816759 [Baffinella frigidus]|nr:hypothetical protein T484DRAFT_1816759 [Cryptophyta sp. CCMP2293]
MHGMTYDSARLPSIGAKNKILPSSVAKIRHSSVEALMMTESDLAAIRSNAISSFMARAGGEYGEPIGNHPGDLFAIRPRFPSNLRKNCDSPKDSFARCASDPSPSWTRTASTPPQHPRRGSTASPSWSSSDDEEHRSPQASLLSLALAAFHPSFPSHAETPSPSARRPSRTVAAKNFPSMRSAPSCAPPVCLVAARGRRASGAHLRLKMPQGL